MRNKGSSMQTCHWELRMYLCPGSWCLCLCATGRLVCVCHLGQTEKRRKPKVRHLTEASFNCVYSKIQTARHMLYFPSLILSKQILTGQQSGSSNTYKHFDTHLLLMSILWGKRKASAQIIRLSKALGGRSEARGLRGRRIPARMDSCLCACVRVYV